MSWIQGMAQRARELLRPHASELEIDEELRDHFEREVERRIRGGAAPDAARREARLHTGGHQSAKEAVRDGWTGRLLADVLSDVRTAVRGIRREPGFTAAVVLSLGLGIGGTTAIFSVVYGVLLRPLPYPDSDRLHLVEIWWNDFSASLSPADFLALRESGAGVADVGGFTFPDAGFALRGNDGPEVVDGATVTAELSRVLQIAPLVGPGLSVATTACEVLISDALWQRRFGRKPDAVGRSLVIEGEPCAVVGVMPEGFDIPGRYGSSIWMGLRPGEPKRRGPFFINTIARLRPGVTPRQAEAALTTRVVAILRDRYGIRNEWRYGLRPEKDVLVGNMRETIWLTFGVVALVLCIAVANVANLLIARGAVRSRELAVRASLGAGRGRLARQLLTDGVVLGVMGGAIGLGIAVATLDVVRANLPALLPRMAEVRFDLPVVAFALALGIAAGLAAGLFPLARLPWAQLGQWVREGGRTSGESVRLGRLRRFLVIAEVALTLAVVCGATLLVKSALRLQAQDPGFAPHGVLSFRVGISETAYTSEQAHLFFETLEDRLRALPGVRSVAYALGLPPNMLDVSNNYTLEGETGDSAGHGGVAEWNAVSPAYFATLGIPVLEGHSFSLADTATAPQVALVNQSFVRRHFRGQSPIGKRLKGGDWDPKAPWTTIVGVVADVPYTGGIWGGNHPTFYEPSAQNRWLRSVLVVVKTAGDPAQLVGPIRRETSALDAGVPLRDVATMTERMDRSASLPRFRGLLFSLLGSLALVLAATGIYGVMAYHVNQRRRETAIRRALGARSAQVVRATLESGLRLAGAGIVIGVLGALVLTRSLAALLYKVDPFDPAVLAGVTALLALVAMLASLVPAMRAARVDPAVILRDE